MVGFGFGFGFGIGLGLGLGVAPSDCHHQPSAISIIFLWNTVQTASAEVEVMVSQHPSSPSSGISVVNTWTVFQDFV